jgi:transcriptional regulator with XRE-family HTH domain
MGTKQLRTSLGLSLTEFAAVAGVDKQTCWRWERYGQRPRARAIRDRLADLEREATTLEGRAAITLRALGELAIQRFNRDLIAARERYAADLRIPVERLTGAADERLSEAERAANAAYSAALDTAQRRAQELLQAPA